MSKTLPGPRALAPAPPSKDHRTGISTQTAQFQADGGSAPQAAHLVPMQTESMRYNPHGLPSRLRAGVEAMSGMDMSDVVVHRNSPKPARLEAQAYARGNDIHLAPGQERYLPHEAWHVAQQRQGRVKPTMQAAGVKVNDDAALEREADAMGSRAMRASDLPPVHLSHASRTPAMRPVVQAGKTNDPVAKAANKAKFDKAMRELNEKITEANKQISNVLKVKAALATDSSTTPMNPAVLVADMETVDSLTISKSEARLANFSSMVKEYVNGLQKSNVTPEVQTALVQSASDASKSIHIPESIHISGNTQNANKKIGAGGLDLGTYYTTRIRPISVSRRVSGLERAGKKFVKRKAGKPYLTAKSKKHLISKVRRETSDDDMAVRRKIAMYLLKESKRNPDRMSAVSARKFAKAYSAKRIVVPGNQENIHAESAILKSLNDAKQIIMQIGGTKVACLACQAYFTNVGKADLLGNNTGYAWVSESSMTQLGFAIETINAAEQYLINLVTLLKKRLTDLRRYTGSAGDKNVEDMEPESDADATDSEDENAMDDAQNLDVIGEIYKASGL